MSAADAPPPGLDGGFSVSDKHIHLAVHAGQSVIRLIAQRGDDVWGASLRGVETDKPLPPQWARAIHEFLAQHPDLDVHTITLGASGLGRDTAHDLLPLVAGTTVRRIVLAHDSVTNYLGSIGDGEGCVIAANTGTVCLAVGPRDTARVDGWGHLLGDAGSLYWIGRSALEAALRGHDGRRQMTALTRAMRDEFPDLELAYLDLQSAPDRVARIASFADVVMDLAASDWVSANILDKAAAHLSEAVQAAIRRVHLSGPQPPRVAAVGKVFHNDTVLRRFTDFLTLQWPTFALTEARGGPVEGAAMLADLDQSHPLYGAVSAAER